jgi:RNA polymerase subunit RPABC4/transcription elongation factor Spt4|tara:strand:+ start:1501 stop:1647 length:147 start_codon:yes stop_codon:yes gene_type:complete
MAKKKLPVIAKGMKELETWKGRLIVINPDKSEIAKKVSILKPGEYGLR